MNSEEIKSALTEYANEDLGYAVEGGEMAVSDCKQGTIFIHHKDGEFTINEASGSELFKGNHPDAVTFLIEKCYIVEIEEEA